MKALVKKLQNEAGLTENQSLKVISILNDYLKSPDFFDDSKNFFSKKYNEFADYIRNEYGDLSEQASNFKSQFAEKADEFGDDIEDMADQIKKKAKEITKDLSDRM